MRSAKAYHIAPTGNPQEFGENCISADFHISLNVARLANIPQKVLDVAAVKSKALEDTMVRKKLANLYMTILPVTRSG